MSTKIQISDDRTILYESPHMQEIIDKVDNFASTDIPVLLTGENGTGKENIARLIHQRSNRRSQPFVAINCSAISPALVESELFGHEKGSFTGAINKRIGAFERANGGTLFLDEIGEMPPEMQVKLLRVLEDGEMQRVGGNETLKARPRIIAATNRDIDTAVKKGKLRPDLYYRLRGTHIHLPALKDRSEDILPLASHFADTVAREHNFPPPGISEAVRSKLEQHAWPGNVRELKQSVSQATILSKLTGTIAPEDLNLGEAAVERLEPSDRDNNQSIEKTFGYKLCMAREEKGWTQTKLAHEVTLKTPKSYTTTEISRWEKNLNMPDQNTVNALAYVLIIDTDRSREDKIEILREFFAAARAGWEKPRATRSSSAQEALGNMLAELRERAELSMSALGKKMQELDPGVYMQHRDIYLLECGSRQRGITKQETLAIIKALDTSYHPLSPEQKLDLYDASQSVLTKNHRAAVVNGQEGALQVSQPIARLKHGKTKSLVLVGDEAEQFFQLRQRLFSFFTDGDNNALHLTQIARCIGKQSEIITALMGNGTESPLRKGSLHDDVKLALCGLLKNLGKSDETINAFQSAFEEMRTLLNYEVQYAYRKR